MLKCYDVELKSRLLLGTARYPSPAILSQAIKVSGTDVVTVSLRRELGSRAHALRPSSAANVLTSSAIGKGEERRDGEAFWTLIREAGVRVLPNTAGCHSAKEAITTAQMAREVFGTTWIKLEVIGDEDTLQPDVFELVEAARVLSEEGFAVFPYTTEDLVVADRLLNAGCHVLMPWGAPIGSGRGLNNVFGLRALRAHFPDVPLIVDAGLGIPSHAAHAMELGCDAVLINTAVAQAVDPVAMALAFSEGVVAGRRAYSAGPMEPRDMAVPSTPVLGKAFLS